MNRNRVLPVLLLVLAVGLAGAGYYLWADRGKGEGGLKLSGNIEVIEVQLSFRIPGWVKERPVDEGMALRTGQVVARLDERELAIDVAARQADVRAGKAALAELKAGSRPEEIAQAEAAAQRAQKALDELLAGSRPEEIKAAEAAAAAAAAEVERSKLNFQRLEELYKRGAAGIQEYDTARLAHDSAKAKLDQADQQFKLAKEGPRQEQIEQARSALKESQEHLALVRKGPRQEFIDQIAARLAQIEQALVMAQTRLEYATLVSPVTAVVLSKNVEPGEYVSAGTPIVTIADLAHVYLRAYVEETDLGRVKLGQAVGVTTDTWPGKVYPGKVSFIAAEAEFTPKNVQTKKERVKLVYRIKVDLDNPTLELKPGMPADGEIVVWTPSSPTS